MTTEKSHARRTPFKPFALLAAFGLALALFSSPANAVSLPLLSTATLTGGAHDRAFAVERDGLGNLFIVGHSSTAASGNDIWVSKWNESTLTVISSRTLNGSGNGEDSARGVALDGVGNVYVTGTSSVPGQGSSLWMGKFTSSLVLISSVNFPVPVFTNVDVAFGMVLVPGGDVYVTNTSTGPSSSKILLARFTSSLAFVSSRTFNNGFLLNYAHGLARDPGGNFYVAGDAPPNNLTSPDIILAKFDPNFVFIASRAVAGGGGNTDNARAITVGADGNIYVTGIINNAGAIVDVWLAKYSPSLAPIGSVSFPSPNAGNALGNAIRATADRLFVAGSLFTTGQSDNAWLAEIDYSLVVKASATYNAGSDRKSTRLNSSHIQKSRMPSSA